MSRVLPVLIFATVAAPVGGAGFDGLAGDRLREAVADAAAVTVHVDRSEAWTLMRETEVAADGSLVGPWSSATCSFGSDVLPVGFSLVSLAPDDWWLNGKSPSGDLYNLIVMSDADAVMRSLRLPGDLAEVSKDFGIWQSGAGYLGGGLVDMYAPPAGLRGDVARALMYVAVSYPSELHGNEGYMVFHDGASPGLNPDYYAILERWSADDPVDAYERRRNEVFGAAQGNTNPFVDYPSLGSYLWGERRGDEFFSGSDDPDFGNHALKGRYSVAADEWLYLSSPYVPADALWSIDGKACESGVSRYRLASLGEGLHEIEFSSDACGLSGKLTIDISR